jgi:predicted ferric reductase
MSLPTIAMLVSLAAAAEQYQNNATSLYLEKLDRSMTQNFLWSLLAFVAVIFAYRSVCRVHAHMRHLACLTNDGTQRYFTIASPTMAWLKDHIFYAPTFHHRRATELKFSKHFNLGTIPTRFQSLFITAIIAVNVFSSVYNIPWSDPALQVMPILRNRTGTLAVGNLIPLVVMATIKNPLIALLDISYDTFNLMHRWLGRLCILQGIAHTLCWMIAKVQKAGWSTVGKSLQHKSMYSGLICTIGFIILLIHSPKLVRSWAYEVFLYTHVVIVAVSLGWLWVHLKGHEAYPQLYMLSAAIGIWGGSRVWRFFTMFRRTWVPARKSCNAAIEVVPGGALRIAITTPRPWTFKPGQSLFLTIPSVGWATSHPFSIAWSGVEESLSRSSSVKTTKTTFDEKQSTTRVRKLEVEEEGPTSFHLIVKARDGMTRHLLEKVRNAGGVDGAQISYSACIEGPYGGHQSFASYGTVMLFASGVGITHQIPYVRELLEGYAAGTVACRRLTLIWVIPSTECLEWIRPWMQEVLGMPKRRDILRVILYITRAGLSQPIRSPSETVKMLRGRPDVQALMIKESAEKMGCMGVSVCAGGGLADEVRRVSRILCAGGVNLDFFETGFGW